jgi:hypothetical protein
MTAPLYRSEAAIRAGAMRALRLRAEAICNRVAGDVTVLDGYQPPVIAVQGRP